MLRGCGGDVVTVPYYSDDYLTLMQGDAAEVLATMPVGSVQTVVTSPPYYGLRDYGTGAAQIGLEASPGEYVARLVDTFQQVRRVLRDDGTVWLNLGDSYASTGGTSGIGPNARVGSTRRQAKDRTRPVTSLAPKNLLGIPWLVAFALQADGWILRNAVVWDKPNAMPESVADRLSTTYELVFLLSRSQRYYFNLDPIRDPLIRPEALSEGIVFGGHKEGSSKIGASARRSGAVYGQQAAARPPGTPPHTNCGPTGKQHTGQHPQGRNPGDVWTIPTTPYPGAHFAVMPPALVRRCVLASSVEGAAVLDPFIGSGTVAMVANQLGRRAIGIDLSEPYLAQVMQRCKDAPLAFEVDGAAS